VNTLPSTRYVPKTRREHFAQGSKVILLIPTDYGAVGEVLEDSARGADDLIPIKVERIVDPKTSRPYLTRQGDEYVTGEYR